MNNQQKFNQSCTDLINILYDLTGDMSIRTDYEEIVSDIEILDKLTTNLKRMGETTVLEQSIETETNKEGETNADKQTNK